MKYRLGLMAVLLVGCAAEPTQTVATDPVSEDVASETTAETTAPQTPAETEIVDAYKQDIFDGLSRELQGMWTVQEPRLPAEAKPFWFFEGNRVSLSYVQDGRLVEQGSDNFRIVGDCAQTNYDPSGRSVDVGVGVFGDDANMMASCWDIDRIGATSLDYRVGPEGLSLVRMGLRPGDALRVSAEAAGIPMLLGRWQSVDDAQSVMVIGLDTVQDFYGDEDLGQAPLQMVQTCRDPVTVDTGAAYLEAFTRGEGDDQQCYTLLSLTADRLDIAYSARGNTLRFERAD